MIISRQKSLVVKKTIFLPININCKLRACAPGDSLFCIFTARNTIAAENFRLSRQQKELKSKTFFCLYFNWKTFNQLFQNLLTKN